MHFCCDTELQGQLMHENLDPLREISYSKVQIQTKRFAIYLENQFKLLYRAL